MSKLIHQLVTITQQKEFLQIPGEDKVDYDFPISVNVYWCACAEMFKAPVEIYRHIHKENNEKETI